MRDAIMLYFTLTFPQKSGHPVKVQLPSFQTQQKNNNSMRNVSWYDYKIFQCIPTHYLGPLTLSEKRNWHTRSPLKDQTCFRFLPCQCLLQRPCHFSLPHARPQLRFFYPFFLNCRVLLKPNALKGILLLTIRKQPSLAISSLIRQLFIWFRTSSKSQRRSLILRFSKRTPSI